jgi:dTMP kinase
VAGLLISFESPEGGGKTTQARLVAARLERLGYPVLLAREPGGTPLGDRVRDLVLHASELEISPLAETLLYCVARAQLVERVLRPALEAGRIVVLDRYADSTLAYQVYGRGLDRGAVERALEVATGGLKPNLTLLLDVDAGLGLIRKAEQAAGGSALEVNRFEAESVAFHERVRAGYLELAAEEPGRWRVIDASQPVELVAGEVWRAVEAVLDGGTQTVSAAR